MRDIVDESVRNVFLQPCEVFISRTPSLVSTILGSCVSVTMYSPETGVGAICHAMLPTVTESKGFRGVDQAVRHLFGKMKALSGSVSGLEIKLFGGANVLLPGEQSLDGQSVGKQNIEAALSTLRELGVTLSAADTGGNQGRKIFFYTHTGEVFLRRFRKMIR